MPGLLDPTPQSPQMGLLSSGEPYPSLLGGAIPSPYGFLSGAVDWWRSQPSFVDRMMSANAASERATAGKSGVDAFRASMNDPEARQLGLDVAADFAFAGMGDVINLRATLERRMMDQLRRRNVADMAQQGYIGTTQLSNGWSIGRYFGPDAVNPRTQYVLMSPQGGPALYGASIDDLLQRGFVKDEPVSIVGGERPPPPDPPGSNVFSFSR